MKFYKFFSFEKKDFFDMQRKALMGLIKVMKRLVLPELTKITSNMIVLSEA